MFSDGKAWSVIFDVSREQLSQLFLILLINQNILVLFHCLTSTWTFMLFPVSTRYAKLTSPIFLTVQSASQGPDNRLAYRLKPF